VFLALICWRIHNSLDAAEKAILVVAHEFAEDPSPYVEKLREAISRLEAKWGKTSGMQEELQEWAKGLPVMRLNLAVEPRGDSPNDLPQTSSSPSLEPPTPPKSEAMPVARFPYIPGLKWDEVSMEFVSNEAIRIRAQNVREIYNFAEMGFKDRRKGDRPDSLWGVLRDGFGKHGGEISWNISVDSKTRDNLKEYVRKIRKRLRAFMEIEDDPFFPYRKSKSYKTKFSISDERPL